MHGALKDMSGADTRRLSAAVLWALLAWLVIHAIHFDRFIYHDSWKHNFPVIYRIATSGACMDLPAWLGTVDNGSPTSIYALSMSLTHLLRVPELYLLSCADLAPRAAVYVHKLQIFCSWALLAFGMYALGRALFRQRATAAYLLVATLFSGACLDASHSDQIVSEMFWLPWFALSMALWHRRLAERDAPLYFNLGGLFFSIALLDHYPHLIALGAVVAAALYVFLYPAGIVPFLRQHWPRLWPTAIVLVVVGMQLLFLKGEISGYSPSLRTDLVVDPEKFGSTGFMQPTALVALFFPLSYLADYDRLFNTLPYYVFKLDLLLFCFGAVPLLIFLAALRAGEAARARLGWGLFLLAIIAVSLQQTRIYFALFHVPFFDLFRGYFLFSMLSVFAFLVLGGYGFDAIADAEPGERAALVRRTLAWTGTAVLVVAFVFAWLIHLVPSPLATLKKLTWPLLLDLLALAGAAWIVWRYAARERQEWCRSVLVALVVLQIPLITGAYRMLAVSSEKMFNGYMLDGVDVARDPQRDTSTGVARKICTQYAQCYLSERRTVSLNLDLNGTFLRNRDEPVFQQDLSRTAQEALAGLSRPDMWLSRQLTPVPGRPVLVATVNAATDVGKLLADNAFVRDGKTGTAKRGASTSGEIIRVKRGGDYIEASYRAPEPQVFSIAVNFDKRWRVVLGEQELAPMPANFGGMAVPIPAGEGTLRFEYGSTRSDLFFLSRYLLLLLGIGGAWLAFRPANVSPQE